LAYTVLAQKVRTPLQMGENYYGSRDFYTYTAAAASHYGMIDLMRIGGITEWLRSAGVAAGAGVHPLAGMGGLGQPRTRRSDPFPTTE
jgi:mandelate racemase